MTALIVDTGALYAQADADEPQHAAVAHALREELDSLVTSQIVVAEADYQILRRLGIEVELKFLDDLAGGNLHRRRADAARADDRSRRRRSLPRSRAWFG